MRRREDPLDSSRRGRPETLGPTSRRCSVFRQQKSHKNVGSPDIRSFQCLDSPSTPPSPYSNVADPYLILTRGVVGLWSLRENSKRSPQGLKTDCGKLGTGRRDVPTATAGAKARFFPTTSRAVDRYQYLGLKSVCENSEKKPQVPPLRCAPVD